MIKRLLTTTTSTTTTTRLFTNNNKMIEPPTPERISELKESYTIIYNELLQSSLNLSIKPRLVAVSKIKPSSDILALYNLGIRHFGENYPQELIEKAAELPTDIQWHFIGALQSNKAKMLASIPNLFAIETLTSTKSASILSKTVLSLSPPRPSGPLNVFLQINTSSEGSKAGLLPLTTSTTSGGAGGGGGTELIELATFILSECPGLRLKGLMTIGSFDSSHSEGPNPDFLSLIETKNHLMKVLYEASQSNELIRKGVEEMGREGLELSMGMSEDFVKAIEAGSTNVRVGSRIFGARGPRV